MHMYDDGQHLVVAANAEDADAVLRELHIHRLAQPDDRGWRQYIDTVAKPFQCTDNTGAQLVEWGCSGGVEVTKTMAEWAAQHGRGLFAVADQ